MAELRAPALSPGLLKLAEYERNVHSVAIPPGIPLASVLRPEFWAHCTGVLRLYAKVECRAQDNAWYAELMVLGVGKYDATMGVIAYADFNARPAKPATVDSDGYTVSFAPKHRWRVIRNADGIVIHKDCATEDEAKAWAAANVT